MLRLLFAVACELRIGRYPCGRWSVGVVRARRWVDNPVETVLQTREEREMLALRVQRYGRAAQRTYTMSNHVDHLDGHGEC